MLTRAHLKVQREVTTVPMEVEPPADIECHHKFRVETVAIEDEEDGDILELKDEHGLHSRKIIVHYYLPPEDGGLSYWQTTLDSASRLLMVASFRIGADYPLLTSSQKRLGSHHIVLPSSLSPSPSSPDRRRSSSLTSSILGATVAAALVLYISWAGYQHAARIRAFFNLIRRVRIVLVDP